MLTRVAADADELQVSANVQGEISVPIARPRGARTCAVALGLVAAVFWAIVAALVGDAGPGAVLASDGNLAVLVLLALLTGLTLLAVWLGRLAFGAPPRLVVAGDRLWIDAPALLRGYPGWEWTQVHRVAVDEGPGRRRGDVGRFHVVSAPVFAATVSERERDPRYLFTRHDGATFPVLALRSRAPNVAIVFSEPEPGLRVRLAARVLARHGGAPRLDRPAEGLLIEVEDAARTRAALADWIADGPILSGADPDGAPAPAPGHAPRRGTPEPAPAHLAIALVAGAYLIPLLAGAALIALAVADWRSGRPSAVGAVLALLGLTVLAPMLPRRRARPRGPEITRDRQPVLFGAIDEAAQALGTAPFDRVVADLRPVAETTVTGVVRRRRTLVLGLPLAAMLTREELLALVARELGGGAGGRGLDALTIRALDHLEATVASMRANWFLAVPARMLELYAGVVERRVPTLRRRRELAADAAAARVAGPSAVAGMLRAATCVECTYPQYWEGNVAPVLAAGRRPPIVDGLRRFLAQPWIRHRLEGVLAQEGGHLTGPSWSHPSLGDRLTALGAARRAAARGRRSGMLDDDDLERAALALIADPAGAAPLSRISWSQVGEDVLLPRIRAGAARARPALGDARADALADPWELIAPVGLAPGAGVDDAAIDLLGSALCLALADAGWATAAEPGDDIVQSLGDDRLRPFAEVTDLVHGRPEARERWEGRCAILGIADVPLAAPAPPPAPG